MHNRSGNMPNSMAGTNLAENMRGNLYHRCINIKYSINDHKSTVMYDVLYECGPEVLVIHSSAGFPFSLKHLRRLKGRVRISIEEHHAFNVITSRIDDFCVFVVFSCEFNDFEHEFMRQICIAKQKTILLLFERFNSSSDESIPVSLHEFKNLYVVGQPL